MPKAPSQTEIVNAAASRLGSTERMVSIDDASPLASHARAHWDGTLRRLMAEHPWNFAVTRASLNAAVREVAFGYERAFALPADCLRLLPYDPCDPVDRFDGEVEGGFILTDAEAPLRVRYISNRLADDVSRWPPHFVSAMELALAAAFAEAMTGSQSLANSMLDLADEALRKAKRRDALENGGRHRRQVTASGDWGAAAAQPYNYWMR